jgi:multicomponent Na+:H+ antiporter subunit B
MSTIVQIVTRWLFGWILVFGLALAFFGHVTPGGGFAGGVVIACGFVLVTLAFGSRRGPAAWMRRAASTLDATGALVFLVVGLAGYFSGAFLASWVQKGPPLFEVGSSTFIVLLNLAILLKVGAGLFAGFMAIAAFGAAGRPARREEAVER